MLFKKVPRDIELEISKYTPDIPELERCRAHHLFIFDDLQRGRRNHSVVNKNAGDCELVATAFTESQFHCWKRLPDPPKVEIEQPVPEDHSGKDSRGFYPIPKTIRKIETHPEPPFQVFDSLVVALPKKDQNSTSEWVEANRSRNRFDHWAKIKGELWLVKPSVFIELDKYMMNTVRFQRTRISLEIPLKEITTKGVRRIITEQEAFMYIGITDVWEPLLDGGYLFKPMPIFNNTSLSRKYYSYTNLEEWEN
jgi:hypothetical protein